MQWNVLPVPTDITQQQDVDRLIARTLERFGRLDMLVNNAGPLGARRGDQPPRPKSSPS